MRVIRTLVYGRINLTIDDIMVYTLQRQKCETYSPGYIRTVALEIFKKGGGGTFAKDHCTIQNTTLEVSIPY